MLVLATSDDVEKRLGRQLTTDEQLRVDGLLEEATLLAATLLPCYPLGLSDEAKDDLAIIISRMVARVLERSQVNALGADSITESAGQVQRVLNFGTGAGQITGGPWLAGTDKVLLKDVCGGDGLSAVALSSGRTGRYRTLDEAGLPTEREWP